MNSKREASHPLRGMLGYLKSKKFCGYIYKVNVSSKKGKGEQGLSRDEIILCIIVFGQNFVEGILMAKCGRNPQEGKITNSSPFLFPSIDFN